MVKRFFITIFILFLWVSPVELLAQTWATQENRVSFGASMVIDGDQIIIARTGLPSMFPAEPYQNGGLFLFSKIDGDWGETAKVIPAELAYGDGFGHAMALAGNTLAVSAPGAMDQCGSVFIFQRSESYGWSQSDLLAPECTTPHRMGTSLALNGDMLFVGAPTADSSGKVHVFKKTSDGWEHLKELSMPDNAPNSNLGASLASTEDGLYAGAPGYLEGSGAVVFYSMTALEGDGAGSLIRPDVDGLSHFGGDLAIEGSHMLVSAPGIDPLISLNNQQPAAGKVIPFRMEGAGNWVEGGVIEIGQPGPDDQQMNPASLAFGVSLGLNKGEAWIGAPFMNGRGGIFIYSFDQDSESWENANTLSPQGLGNLATFGEHFSVSGTLAAVGAMREGFGEGKSYIYSKEDGDWKLDNAVMDSGRGLETIIAGENSCEEGNGKVDEFTCAGIDLLAFMPVKDVGGSQGGMVNDIWGWTDPLTDKEYVLMGRSDGTSFIDITDPSNPVYLGNLPATEGSTPNAWRDVKVHANHAYVVADNVGEHGMQIFDLTQLRTVSNPPVEFEQTALYDGVHSAHNVIINEQSGFAYIVGANGGGNTCGGGLHMVNIQDPANPSFAGCFNDQSSAVSGRGYSHDAQCLIYTGPDPDYQGQEICFGSNETALSIADVTDKENPISISTVSYPNVAYAHQGWLTDDGKYFYMNDEADELAGGTDGTRTMIWDVTDLDDPVYAGEYISENKASDHNLYIKENLIYESNYVSGLRILDITDPLHPKEVGYFDTVPWGEDAPGFAGSWSNYPYFKSGTIVVTSVTEGLFLLKKSNTLIP